MRYSLKMSINSNKLPSRGDGKLQSVDNTSQLHLWYISLNMIPKI